MIYFEDFMLLFGIVISIVAIVVSVINVGKTYKKMANEYKSKKIALGGIGFFILIYFIIEYIRKSLLYG